MTPLDADIKENSKIELLDMRDSNANLMYQNGISLIYLKAIKDVLGDEIAKKCATTKDLWKY